MNTRNAKFRRPVPNRTANRVASGTANRAANRSASRAPKLCAGLPTPHQNQPHTKLCAGLLTPHRAAFTLVELLIVLTVIGILVGLLIPAITGAMGTARELAIRTEMVQIEQAIEKFKTDYGFYPPSFEQFNRGSSNADLAAGVAQFLPYLNRIAPNHQESTFFPGGTVPRINVWWNKIGRHLDQQSSLVFWLSGMCKSKQYPITGGAVGLIEPFAGPTRFVGTVTPPVEIERDARFDFDKGQLVYGVGPNVIVPDPDGSGGFVGTPVVDGSAEEVDRDGTTNAVIFNEVDQIAGGVALVAAYRQPYGPSNGDRRFRYRDAGSYNIVPYAYSTQISGAPSDTRGRSTGDPLVPDDFVNPKTFQLISFGMDGEAGVPNELPNNEFERQENAFVLSSAPEFVKRGYDNMTNFAGGRLELFVIENE